ncbi:MAG: Crp/Fnr family transcriptional regulator [Rhodobacteraceae bacterium]|nr:Crp/Fnr family transcriptional regulator [Paracoccaceae bacterium]
MPKPHLSCGTCPIRHNAVCALCTEAELRRLNGIKYYRNYVPGQPIVHAGAQHHFVASVVSGTVTLSQTLVDGRVQMVGLLLPSDFIGRPGRAETLYTAEAITPVMLCCFRRKPFEALMGEIPHIAQRLLEMTLDELDAARNWMLVLGRKRARERIASFLVMLAWRRGWLQRGGGRLRQARGIDKAAARRFDLPLRREEMANYLGLTLETVSRQMSALKQDGVIVQQGQRHVAIPDFARLLEEAGEGSHSSLMGG